MPSRDHDFDRLSPQEYPEPDDAGDTVLCPRCRVSIYDDSERCPECGHYLTNEDGSRKPMWVVAVLLVCLAMSIGWVIWG